MKNSSVILIVVLAIIIGALAGAWYIKNKNVCYDLPKDGSTDYWGPLYWKSLHSTVERIPCSICQNEAVEMMRFLHDKVNLKLGKKLYDEQNFYKWVDKICELKQVSK